MRVHSIFLHLMRSLSECPLWSTLRVRPSHRVFYHGVKQRGGILHIGLQCVRKCAREKCVLLGSRLVRQNLMAFSNVQLAKPGVANKECVLQGLNWS